MLRLGIVVGETGTDCVLIDADFTMLGAVRQPATPDVMSGIEAVLEQILTQTAIDPAQITAVMLGTSHCFTALLEGKQLAKVGVIRMGQAKSTVPPLCEAPEWLRETVGLRYLQVAGGHEMDGSISGNEPSRREIEAFLLRKENRGMESVVITGTFSPINDAHERMVAAWVRDMLGNDFPVTCSHELGSVGFIERENAAILNAALAKVMTQALKGLGSLLKRKRINAAVYFTQNDGTLMSYEYALRFPIRTLRSGVTNSFRGASFLTGVEDGVVVDVRRSTTNIGVLEGGFPKEGRRGQYIAGVRVNVHMPEIVSLPFGGSDPLDDTNLDELYHAVQRFQPRYEPLPIVFVGEGSSRFVSHFKYPWSEVLWPRDHPYVNAIGACIAPISGNSDRMYWLDTMTQADAVERAKQETIKAAIQAGARPETVVIQTVKTIPLAYVPSKALRIKVKAVGSL